MTARENKYVISIDESTHETKAVLYDDMFAQIYQPFYARVSDLMQNLSRITGYP